MKELKIFHDIDMAVEEGFGLKESEQVLINDMFNVTLPYFKSGNNSIARQPTQRLKLDDGAELAKYLAWFLRVLHATFGDDKHISATLFEESGSQRLPIRLVAIHLDSPECCGISVQAFEDSNLIDKLTDLYTLLSGDHSCGPVCYRRVARAFDTVEKGGNKIPTVFIAKPDEKRYWTASIAMRDADEVASEIMTWRNAHIME